MASFFQTPPLPGSLPDSSRARVLPLPWALDPVPPRAGRLPAFGEPPWRGRGDARSDPRCTLVGLAQSSQATPSKGVCRVRPPSSRDTVRRGSVSWDRLRGGQLEPRLSSPRRSREGLHSETGVLLGAHHPPCLSPGPRPFPGIPAQGGAPRADVSPPSLARAVSCPLPRAGSSVVTAVV